MTGVIYSSMKKTVLLLESYVFGLKQMKMSITTTFIKQAKQYFRLDYYIVLRYMDHFIFSI